MGKLNVTMMRYLTKDDFRVLTAVRMINAKTILLTEFNLKSVFRSKWE